MVLVKKQPGESDDKLITRFKRKVLEEDIIGEARKRKEFKSANELMKQRVKELKNTI